MFEKVRLAMCNRLRKTWLFRSMMHCAMRLLARLRARYYRQFCFFLYEFELEGGSLLKLCHKRMIGRTHRRMRQAVLRTVVCGSIFLASSALSGSAFADPTHEIANHHAQIDRLMTPGPGQKAGELQRKEILLAALNREKVDKNSARLAIQSMAEIFDFRLSRAGDRYVYELGNGRKIAMLRYERNKRIYEARLNADNQYEARLLDIAEDSPAMARSTAPDAFDDDGEIDVERQAIVAAPQPPAPNAPRAALDDALAARPSPDSAFPDTLPLPDATDNPSFDDDEFDAPSVADAAKDDTDSSTANDEAVDDDTRSGNALRALSGSKMNLPLDDAPEHEVKTIPNDDRGNDNAQIPNSPDRNQTTPEQNDNTQSIQLKCKSDDKTQSVISALMLAIGLLTFVIGFITVILPAIRMRRRVRQMGLEIVDRIWISRHQQLVHVRWNDRDFVIIVMPDKVQCLVASDKANDLFDFLRAKSYWNGMADQPISDRQLTSLLAAFKNKSKTPPCEPDMTVQVPPNTHDSTAQGFEALSTPSANASQDETVQGLDDDIVEYFDEESELFDDAPTNGTGNGDKSNDHNG